MLPSFHDDYLASYEVNCEARQITLCIRPGAGKQDQIRRTVVFHGVEGYQFENDAFGNIIFSLDATPVEQLLAEYGSRITESFHRTGAPGPWAADFASAMQTFNAQGVQGFVLSSSYGLSGWVLAGKVSVERT